MHRLTNVRVVEADVWEVLSQLPPSSLSRVHVFFPDPWPKARHHKRRLVQAPFVAVVADRLASGGLVHLATDWAPYAAGIRAVLDDEPQLIVIDRPTAADGGGPPADEGAPGRLAVTTYERRGVAAGRPVVELVARRRPLQH